MVERNNYGRAQKEGWPQRACGGWERVDIEGDEEADSVQRGERWRKDRRRRKKPKRETIFLLFSIFVAEIVEARRGSEEGWLSDLGCQERRGVRILCAGARLAQTLRAASLVSCKSGTVASAWRVSGENVRARARPSVSRCIFVHGFLQISDSNVANCLRKQKPRSQSRVGPMTFARAARVPWHCSPRCNNGERKSRRTSTLPMIVVRGSTSATRIPRMDKDVRRKCGKVRRALFQLLLIVGGKFLGGETIRASTRF